LKLENLIEQGPPSGTQPTGQAAIYYQIGTEPPVQVLTPFFQMTSEPQSLVLWFYDPSAKPLLFIAYIAIQKIYLGPGEYKGNVNDIQAGLGIASSAENGLVWTAGNDTASDLTTYFVKGNASALIGTFSVQALVPGPLFGPPDDPVPANQPSADILFSFFSNQGSGLEDRR